MTKEEKERLERFTLAAMQGLLSNPDYNPSLDVMTSDAIRFAQEQIKKLDEVK